jgi:hypothetical protein
MDHKCHEEGRKDLKRTKWIKGKKNPRSVHVGFVVDKVSLGQVFPQYFGFPLSISFHRSSITCKSENKLIIFIFITGLHNKP